jgi:hypothetical protein
MNTRLNTPLLMKIRERGQSGGTHVSGRVCDSGRLCDTVVPAVACGLKTNKKALLHRRSLAGRSGRGGSFPRPARPDTHTRAEKWCPLRPRWTHQFRLVTLRLKAEAWRPRRRRHRLLLTAMGIPPAPARPLPTRRPSPPPRAAETRFTRTRHPTPCMRWPGV